MGHHGTWFTVSNSMAGETDFFVNVREITLQSTHQAEWTATLLISDEQWRCVLQAV